MDGPWENYSGGSQGSTPSSAAPWEKYASTQNKSGGGLEDTSQAVQRGFVAGVAGAPGDIAQMLTNRATATYDSLRGLAAPYTQQTPTHVTVPGTSSWMKENLPGKDIGERHPIAQGIGEFGGAMAIPLPTKSGAATTGARIIGDVAKGAGGKVIEIGKDLIPGAERRAQETVSAVGQPSDASILGHKMYQDLTPRYNQLLKDRRATVDTLKKEYFTQPHEKEVEVANDYRKYLDDLLTTKSRDLTEDERKLIDTLKARIGSDPSIVRIEGERRFLGQVAQGKAEGYKAINTLFAGEMKNNLEKILSEKIPVSEKFINAYRDASRPINLFEDTMGGKRLTTGASDYLPNIPKYDPAGLPKAFFKTKDSVKLLKEFTGGDQKLVEQMAGEHAASELHGMSARDADKWLKNNEIWLDEVPGVQKDVEDYVARLDKVALTQKWAGRGLLGGAMLGGAEYGYWTLRRLFGI